MRRAILDLLRTSPMTQAQLGKELGLTAASLNYHMRILRSNKIVTIHRKEREKHKIMQIFFSPVAYLFVYDLYGLPKNIARYFYPVSLERTRGAISAFKCSGESNFLGASSNEINITSERFSRFLVEIAREYESREVGFGSEKLTYEIYAKALKRLIASLNLTGRAVLASTDRLTRR
jgi:DNA-binding transcriptional ArsR family regulator